MEELIEGKKKGKKDRRKGCQCLIGPQSVTDALLNEEEACFTIPCSEGFLISEGSRPFCTGHISFLSVPA